ncbi:MAG: ATP-binding protein [Thermoprotei archaeon]
MIRDRENVVRALVDWNFWAKEQFTGVPRRYAEELLRLMETGLAVDLVGVKRSGKSTVINQAVKRLIESGVDPKATLIVNFEDPRLGEVDSGEDLFELLSIYRQLTGHKGKPYVFLDEVQKVRDWEGFVRSVVDRKEALVAVTGSTRLFKRGRTSEALSGRHVSLEITPLSFVEFLEFKGVRIRGELEAIAREDEVKGLLLEYLRFGGFPLVVQAKDEETKTRILLQLYDDIITKDVIEACRIRATKDVRELSLFYVTNVGNRVSFRSVSNSLGIPISTALRLTECLSDSMLVYFVPPLSPKLKEMVKGEKKVYVVDSGLSNVVGFRLNESLGSLLENAVYMELRRRYGENSIYYYRGRNEVDFVIVRDNEVKVVYQVAFRYVDRETKGLKELRRRKEVPSYVITFDEEGERDGFRLLKAWKWFLNMYNEGV